VTDDSLQVQVPGLAAPVPTGLLIDGRWRPASGGATFDVSDPADGTLLARVADGRLLAAVDVWPEEPVPADSPWRQVDGLVFSGHRAGGIPAAFLEIGDMVLDDLGLLARGLAPVRLQQAAPELVGRYRNRPAG